MYGKLAGMTGTADTEAYEFQEIYGLETVVVPTHKQMIREDRLDLVYRTAKEKYKAIIDEIRDCYERSQPVLVGTTSIENSELLSAMLDKEKLPHQVLNAKQHAREAEIVAQAGRPKMVTIATNMAGRGTDIVLGGNVEKQVELVEAAEGLPDAEKKARIEKLRGEWQSLHDKVIGAGGLHIIGTERHESRRVDNQLRGRSGRQGDPGSSRFFMALEDPLLRIFAGDRINRIMVMLKMPEGEAIEHSMVTRSIESAQRKVEARNFDIRKQLLEYDDVANDQRKTIYALRNELLESRGRLAAHRRPARRRGHRPVPPVRAGRERRGAVGHRRPGDRAQGGAGPRAAGQGVAREGARTAGRGACSSASSPRPARPTTRRSRRAPRPQFRQYERYMTLQILDSHWREHLAALDHLRQGIHLRGYAQKNPEAGIQARGLRAVRRDDRGGEAGSDQAPDDGRGVAAGGGAAGRRQAARGKRAAAARRLRGRARRGLRRRRSGRPPRSPRHSPWCARRRKSAATIPAPAARARNTSTATAS